MLFRIDKEMDNLNNVTEERARNRHSQKIDLRHFFHCFQWGKNRVFNNGAGAVHYPCGKRMKLDDYLWSYVIFNPRWIKDLNAKSTTISIGPYKDSIGKYIYHQKEFIRQEIKSREPKVTNWNMLHSV